MGWNLTANAEFCKATLQDGTNHYHDACHACYDLDTGLWDSTTLNLAAQENLKSMKFVDIGAMILISCMVSVACARELDDITTCRLMRKPIMRNPRELNWFQLPLFLLETIRHFVLLPLLTKTIPWLVLYQGSDALSICLNAVALLFILECDDFIFCILSEQTQAELMSKSGHYQLREHDVQLLTMTKRVHTRLLMLAIPYTFIQYQFGGGRQHTNFWVEEEQHWETTAGLSTLHNRGFFHSEIGEADGTVEFFSMKSKYVEHMNYIYLLGGVITTAIIACTRITRFSASRQWLQDNVLALKNMAIDIVQHCLKWYIGWWIIDYWVLFCFWMNHHTADTDFGWDRGISYAACSQARWDGDTANAGCEICKEPADCVACHELHGPDALCSIQEGNAIHGRYWNPFS